jgi:hypothetical protein
VNRAGRQDRRATIDLQGPDGEAGQVVGAISAMPWRAETVTIVAGAAGCESNRAGGNALEAVLRRFTPQTRRQA